VREFRRVRRIEHRHFGAAQALGAADLRVLLELIESAGDELDGRLGWYRPVGHQQRACPGIEKRLGEA
jgi:hypothetical protein